MRVDWRVNSILLESLMCKNTWIFSLVLLIIQFLRITSSIESYDRREDKLVLYKIVLNTYLTKIGFPRINPYWRSRAQFGRIIGNTHDETYSLYRLGKRLSSGANYYIETGRTDGLDDTRNNPSVLDSFYGLGILQGNGTSTTRAFFDSKHTYVSMMSRITPSPDWFIGVDSFQLCTQGNWIDTFTIELDLLGASMKNPIGSTTVKKRTGRKGFIRRISPLYSTNPKRSFYHAKFPRLPPIATLTFIKLKEYTNNNNEENGIERKFIDNYKPIPTYSNGHENSIDYKELHRDPIVLEEPVVKNHKYYGYETTDDTGSRMTNRNENKKTAIINDIALSYGLSMKRRNFTARDRGTRKNKLPGNLEGTTSGSAHNYNTIQWSIENSRNKNSNKSEWPKIIKLPDRQENSRKLHMKKTNFYSKEKRYKDRSPRDCKLGDWSAWSACSRTCGVGETQRSRSIITKSRRGGKPCQALRETKWCGSATPCSTDYNSFANFPNT